MDANPTEAEEKARRDAETTAEAKDASAKSVDAKGALDANPTEVEETARRDAETTAETRDASAQTVDANGILDAQSTEAEETARRDAETTAETRDASARTVDANGILDAQPTEAEETARRIKDKLMRAREGRQRFPRQMTSAVDVSDITEGKPELDKEGRPNANDDAYLPQEYDGRAKASFGSRPGRIRLTAKGNRIFSQWFGKLSTQVDTGQISGATETYKETAQMASKTYTPNMARQLLKGTVGAAMKAMDVGMVFMFLVDPFFNGVFPDATSLLNSDTFTKVITQSTQLQIDKITTANQDVDAQNIEYEISSAHKLFPLLSGPLEAIDMEIPVAKGDPYWNQVRVQAIIDAMCEKFLLDPLTPFYTSLVQSLDSIDTYNQIKDDPSESLLDYVNFTNEMYDEMYRQAYSNVCAHYGGVVYEDVYPATDPMMKGRARFQCGYATGDACLARAEQYYSGIVTGGNYAEWYSASQVNTTIQGLAHETPTVAGGCTACAFGSGMDFNYSNCAVQDYTNGTLPTRLEIANPGSGYTNGTCHPLIIGGFGSGAQITATFSGGMMSSITVDNTGSGYTSAPRLDFSPCGPGTGAGVTGLGMSTSQPVDGMCMITTMSLRAACEGTDPGQQGNYDPVGHACTFTPQYCQSLGTCYNESDKMCYLPSDLLEGLSFVFGVGGPREWIRINGCHFNGSMNQILSLTPLGLFTSSGQTFARDMIANHKNWSEGLKQTFTDPTTATLFAAMTLPITTSVFLAAADAAGAAAVTAAAASATALFTFPTPAILVAAGAEASSGPGAILAVATLVALGIEIGVQMAQSNEVIGKAIPDATENATTASNYTVGGWLQNSGANAPKSQGFSDGWLTKPIRAHMVTHGIWPPPVWPATGPDTALPTDPTLVLGDFTDLPGGELRAFYTSGEVMELLMLAYVAAFGTLGAQTFQEFASTPANIEIAVNTYTSTNVDVPKASCAPDNKIWAGAKSSENSAWCMSPFPGDVYTDKMNIGELAQAGPAPPGGSTNNESFRTSNAWTDGSDPTTAQYPMTPVYNQRPVTDQYWYYQLSYDKNTMVGMTGLLTLGDLIVQQSGVGLLVDGTCDLVIPASPAGGQATGTAAIVGGKVTSAQITSPGYGYTTSPSVSLSPACGGGSAGFSPPGISQITGMPKNLWNTEILKVYFDGWTINQMRQYYCDRSFKIDITGATVDPRCWGYMSVTFNNNYTYVPTAFNGRS